MRFASFRSGGRAGLATAVGSDGPFVGFYSDEGGYPGSLDHLIQGGRTALEAAAAGTPVVCARIDPLPEVLGDGALLVTLSAAPQILSSPANGVCPASPS